MGSMFSVDAEKLQSAFRFEPDMSGLMNSLGLNISSEDMGQIMSALLTGYQQYAASHPEADYSALGQAVIGYLQTDEARSVITRNIMEIIQANGGLTVSQDQLRQLITDIMTGYQQYAAENGYTDPDRFNEYLAEYLQTPQAQAIIGAWAQEALGDFSEITVTDEQMNKLVSDIISGYSAYASANGMPDPTKIGEHFSAYLETAQAQAILASGLTGMVDMSGMEEQFARAVEEGFSIDSQALSHAFSMNMTSQEFTELMMSMNSSEAATYEGNLTNLGYVDFDTPTLINIYPIDFESKEHVVDILDAYNSRMEAEGKDEQVITYTDMVGALMSSVTDIIDIISYVLIAFVSISLVVSSIMIGVITYISVLERQKEIGILRAIGASKGNISQVFNAETFIIGLCAGLMGIGVSLLILIPGNALIHHLAGTNDISAVLPALPAVILVVLSVVLTLIGGIIPSRKAAKSDPVAALRSE